MLISLGDGETEAPGFPESLMLHQSSMSILPAFCSGTESFVAFKYSKSSCHDLSLISYLWLDFLEEATFGCISKAVTISDIGRDFISYSW